MRPPWIEGFPPTLNPSHIEGIKHGGILFTCENAASGYAATWAWRSLGIGCWLCLDLEQELGPKGGLGKWLGLGLDFSSNFGLSSDS